MTIKVVPLGAGQDVGRSCVLVSVGGKNVMFDCGMHILTELNNSNVFALSILYSCPLTSHKHGI